MDSGQKKIWIIDGYTDNVGNWEIEVFTNLEDAEKEFADYIESYNARRCEDDNWFAITDNDCEYIRLTERSINL